MNEIDETINLIKSLVDTDRFDCVSLKIRSAKALASEIERLRLDASKGQKDYCDLIARHDAQHNEIERLTKCLHQANASTEDFERKWYLAMGETEDLKEQKSESAQDWYLISLRDEFAKAALQGLLSDPSLDMEYDETASLSYCYADAMMKERNK